MNLEFSKIVYNMYEEFECKPKIIDNNNIFLLLLKKDMYKDALKFYKEKIQGFENDFSLSRFVHLNIKLKNYDLATETVLKIKNKKYINIVIVN